MFFKVPMKKARNFGRSLEFYYVACLSILKEKTSSMLKTNNFKVYIFYLFSDHS